MRRLEKQAGGPARTRVVLVLAAVLGINSADSGAVGAVAVGLEQSLHISNTELGLLVTVSSIVGAAATLPVGHLVDRVNRVRLLSVSIVGWAVAEAVSGAAFSFPMLLAVRVALGGVTATAGPAVASLTGDLFPADDRSKAYGLILGGELVGTGMGIVVSGGLAAVLGWRVGIAVLALPSFALAWLLPRVLVEPARGGPSEIPDGADAIPQGHGSARRTPAGASRSLWHALEYVVSVRTNVVMIVASSLGYFFFAGLRTFVLLFARAQYGLGQVTAVGFVVLLGVAAFAGLILAGRLADSRRSRGRRGARLAVAGVAYLAGAAAVLPGMLSDSLFVALPLFMVAAFALAAPNPPLDAARLQVVPPSMWGRAEGVRTLLRSVMEASAPLLFGIISAHFAGTRVSSTAGSNTVLTAGQAHGLRMAFVVMLAPLAASGAILLWARRFYPADAERAEREAREEAEGVR
jgi:MFS family permease